MNRTGPARKWLWIGGAALLVSIAAGLWTGATLLERKLQPYLRQQAILYLRRRFQCDVELASLKVSAPGLSPLRSLVGKESGTVVHVEGGGLTMRRQGSATAAPLISIRAFRFDVDAGSVFDNAKKLDVVELQGVTLNVPPKGDPMREAGGAHEPKDATDASKGGGVEIGTVVARDVALAIIPAVPGKQPLKFAISNLRLESVGRNKAMRYIAELINPKPRGLIRSSGSFGPWASGEPGDTPLNGTYSLEKADLGVFPAIAGILDSKGNFAGSLSAIVANGSATVPDFRLTASGNPVPLTTAFQVQVDGQNGNTVLQPVWAVLGSTRFTTSGAVLRKNGDAQRTISLDVSMPAGNLRDVLRLAMKGKPMMEGTLALKTSILIPPLSEKVLDKLVLDGNFRIDSGRFGRPEIQDKIDSLSRRGQGQPANREISDVFSGMKGIFRLEGRDLVFRSLAFDTPGAAIQLAGQYDMRNDALDFRGSLSLQATVSQTMKGWKHLLLKPADRFFEKNGAGTYLRIRIDGTAQAPHFGLDHTGGAH